MVLEFGVFNHLDRNDLPLSAFYEERLKVIEAFDRCGCVDIIKFFGILGLKPPA